MRSDNNEDVLKDLRRQVRSRQRQSTPWYYVLPAGACMDVQLRNHLPEVLPDGPVIGGKETTDSFQR